MARITVRRRGHLRFDHATAAKSLEEAIQAHMKKREAAHLDVDDAPLRQYSALYRMQLEAIGERTDADLRRSGELLRNVHLVRSEVRNGRVTLVFGVGTGTSPSTPRPPPWVFAGTPEQNARALARWKAAPKKPTRSPPHDQLLAWHMRGNGRSPPRRILGVSPSGRREVLAKLERAPVFKS